MLLKKLTKEAHKPVLCASWAAFINIIGKFIFLPPWFILMGRIRRDAGDCISVFFSMKEPSLSATHIFQ
jgi:hypothetical protein